MYTTMINDAIRVGLEFVAHYELYGIALLVGAVMGWVARSAAIFTFKRVRGTQ